MTIHKARERAIAEGDDVLLYAGVPGVWAPKTGWPCLVTGFHSDTGDYRVLMRQPETIGSDGAEDMQVVVLTREHILEIADKLRAH